jgi:hypothetical protein
VLLYASAVDNQGKGSGLDEDDWDHIRYPCDWDVGYGDRKAGELQGQDDVDVVETEILSGAGSCNC